jgi:2-amino-4-ketopentanoate thiolase alpha subunit
MSGGERGWAAGRWVRIHRVELEPTDRSPSVPEDTAAVPFELWINGWLHQEAQLGERVRIETLSGREEEGTLVEVDPGYWHTFGSPPEPLRRAGTRAFALVREAGET